MVFRECLFADTNSGQERWLFTSVAWGYCAIDDVPSGIPFEFENRLLTLLLSWVGEE
jgi:hypothetical protein